MQEDIGVVMSRGIQVEEFKIQRMRKPSYGMPVAGVVSGKSPSYGSPSQSGAHVRVLEDVLVVVVIDKIVLDGLSFLNYLHNFLLRPRSLFLEIRSFSRK